MKWGFQLDQVQLEFWIGLTQDGHHDVIFEDLDGAAGDEVEHGQHVSAVDQSVSGRRVGGLEAHGQGPQAAFSGSSKGLAAVEQVLVEVKADICLQALWETLQHLNKKHGSKQRDRSQEVARKWNSLPRGWIQVEFFCRSN